MRGDQQHNKWPHQIQNLASVKEVRILVLRLLRVSFSCFSMGGLGGKVGRACEEVVVVYWVNICESSGHAHRGCPR